MTDAYLQGPPSAFEQTFESPARRIIIRKRTYVRRNGHRLRNSSHVDAGMPSCTISFAKPSLRAAILARP